MLFIVIYLMAILLIILKIHKQNKEKKEIEKASKDALKLYEDIRSGKISFYK